MKNVISPEQAQAILARSDDVSGSTIDALCQTIIEQAKELERFQRVCDEALPREYIECPECGKPHIEGARFDKPEIDGRKRPHHTHRCYHCEHVWDSGRWSFGADVPKPEGPIHVVEGPLSTPDKARLLDELQQLMRLDRKTPLTAVFSGLPGQTIETEAVEERPLRAFLTDKK